MSAKPSTELLQSIHSLLVNHGYEKSASSFLKEANIKKSDTALNLVDIFAAHKPMNGKKAPAKKDSSSDSSSSDSDSDDEAPAKKPVPAKVVAKAAPMKKTVSSDSSSSDSSSEDEAPAKKPVPAAKPVAKAATVKKAASSSDSESSSSSSSEDEAPAKKSVPAAKPVAKAAPVKKADSSSSSSSSSSDSSSEDEAPAKPAAGKPKVVAAVKKPSSSSSSSSSDSSDSSSSDEEAPPKKVAKKTESATPAKSAVVSTPSTPSGGNPEHKIYVKGLPWLASEAEVKDFFKDCGTVVSTECPMDENGRSSGTAYVKFSQRSELDAALALDGQLWPGTERWLKIQEGFDKPERRTFSEIGAKPEGCDTVFIGNLPWDVTEEQMREIFGVCGDISSVRFAQGEDGGFRGFGHVSFYDGDCVDEAVKLAGTQLNGRAIRVDYAPPRNRESSGGRGAGRGAGGRGGGRGTPGRGRGGPSTPNKNKGTIGAGGSGKKMTFDE